MTLILARDSFFLGGVLKQVNQMALVIPLDQTNDDSIKIGKTKHEIAVQSDRSSRPLCSCTARPLALMAAFLQCFGMRITGKQIQAFFYCPG